MKNQLLFKVSQYIYILIMSIFYVPEIQAQWNFQDQSAILDIAGNQEASLVLAKPLTNFTGTLQIPKENNQWCVQSLTPDAHIEFIGGQLSQANGKNSISGTWKAPLFEKGRCVRASSKINLKGSQALSYVDQTVEDIIVISSTSNSISGSPYFTNAITLQDEFSSLTLSMTTKLTQDIVLNGGKLILGNDLKLHDQAAITGNGIVDVKHYSLKLATTLQRSYNHNLIFWNAGDITLSGYTALSGIWTFSGDNAYSILAGNGNVLDISGGGIISVGPNHTLYLAGITIKGLGAGGGNLWMDPTATIKCSDTAFELAGSYTCTGGSVIITDSHCSLQISAPVYWVVAGPAASLIIDKGVFSYDALGTAPIYPPPFLPLYGGHITVVPPGEVFSLKSAIRLGVFEFILSDAQGINYIPQAVALGSQTVVRFVNFDVTQPKNMTLDGNGFRASYGAASNSGVIIDENVTLLIQNMIIDNLKFSKVRLDGQNDTKAQFKFGNNITIVLSETFSVDETAITFVGSNCVVDGAGNDVYLNTSQCLKLDQNAALTLKNMTLHVNVADAIYSLTNTTSLTLDNVWIVLNGVTWNFNSGNLSINNLVTIHNQVNTPNGSQLTFSSNGYLTINTGSILTFNPGCALAYYPNTVSDSTVGQSKRHIHLYDATSMLQLYGCTVDTGTTGMAIDQGIVSINNVVDWLIPSTEGNELEINDAASIIISPGATMRLNGPMRYRNF